MSGLYCDSFGWLPLDNSGTDATNLKLDAAGYYVVPGSGATAFARTVDTGAFGANCLRYAGAASLGTVPRSNICEVARPLPADVGEGVYGQRFYVEEANSVTNSKPFIGFWDLVTRTRLVTVAFEEFGVVSVYAGDVSGALLGRSRAGVWPLATWFFCEVRAKISDSAGEIEVRINTEPVINLVSQDTKPAGAGGDYFNGISWGTEGFSAGFSAEQYAFRVMDFYLVDDQGAINNSFLGNVRARAMPTAGAGASTDFTKAGAQPTNWQAASNTSLDDTSYVHSGTVGNKDLYSLSPILGAQTVHFVQVRGFYRMDDATQRVAHNLFKVGATTAQGADHYVDQSYAGATDVFETNPATGLGLIGTDVNGAWIGPLVAA